MVSFTRLSISNFKRFSGMHQIDLQGEGRVTVIAAENGVGKTTLMEAIHISLFGERGFLHLFPKGDFRSWLDSAYSVDGTGDRQISLGLEMKDEIMGWIRISRKYWLLDEDLGGFHEEVGIAVEGKPLEREKGKSINSTSEKWIEEFLPMGAMTKFLVDGERLNSLDPKRIGEEVSRGIDDIVGIGLLNRIIRRSNFLTRKSLKSLTNEDQGQSFDQAFELLEEYQKEVVLAHKELSSFTNRSSSISEEIEEIQNEIESISKSDGNENAHLRMEYSVSQAELTSARGQIQNSVFGPMPFLIAGVPEDLDEWGVIDTLEKKKSREDTEKKLLFLRKTIEKSGVGDELGSEIIRTGEAIVKDSTMDAEGFLDSLSSNQIESIIAAHSRIGLAEFGDQELLDSLGYALSKLERFEEAESNLREGNSGSGVSEKAVRLRDLSTELGSVQAEIARLKGLISQKISNRNEVEAFVNRLSQNSDPDSIVNLRLGRLDDIRELCQLVSKSVREDFAAPLEESFKEGFELLSRKSGLLEHVRIDPEDYSVDLSMRGFDGNWLDRGLSATERQHVGLSLVFALRRASTKWSLPLPVIIDTPTSRMDRKHKGWSVTKFYPELSNQVIVFATSDDLADGLFNELEESGVLGVQNLISEVSDNSVKVAPTNLGGFFGGE